jgi:hypothetical protein
MTPPIRHVVGDGRGHRTTQTLDAIARRNQLILEAGDRYFPGLSGREAARHLRVALLRYRCGAWRRTRTETSCPERHLGRLEELLWRLLRVHDHVPSDKLIRTALSRSESANSFLGGVIDESGGYKSQLGTYSIYPPDRSRP